MSVFLVEMYTIKSEKQAEFKPALKEFIKYKKETPTIFKGIKSWKLYRQDYGGVSGMYIEMWEYDSIADMDNINKRMFNDERMKKIGRGFHLLVEPATFSANIWNPVE